jgi:hypothetical protein
MVGGIGHNHHAESFPPPHEQLYPDMDTHVKLPIANPCQVRYHAPQFAVAIIVSMAEKRAKLKPASWPLILLE